MSWTAPRTWVAGEVVTAAQLNTHVRDDLNWIAGPDGRSASFPGSPVDGQVFDYLADATNGVVWRFKYNTGEATYKWEFVGGPPLSVQGISGNTSSSTLASIGGALVLARAGDYAFFYGADLFPAAGDFNDVIADIGNGTVTGTQLVHKRSAASNDSNLSLAKFCVITGIAAGTTFNMRLANSNNSTRVDAANGYITAVPRRVS